MACWRTLTVAILTLQNFVVSTPCHMESVLPLSFGIFQQWTNLAPFSMWLTRWLWIPDTSWYGTTITSGLHSSLCSANTTKPFNIHFCFHMALRDGGFLLTKMQTMNGRLLNINIITIVCSLKTASQLLAVWVLNTHVICTLGLKKHNWSFWDGVAPLQKAHGHRPFHFLQASLALDIGHQSKQWTVLLWLGLMESQLFLSQWPSTRTGLK